MASVLVIPNSGIISFDSLAYSNLQIQPLSTSPRISYDGAGGIKISSQTFAASALERFSVEGNQGRLFTVSDVLTGILFSVNDISGLPILEVKDTDTITAGKYNTNTFIISGTRIFVGLSAYPSTTKLAISGNTTIVGTLSTSGVITALDGNSNQWNASYTNLIYNSTAYLSGFNSTAITQNSASWNTAYTNLIYNSTAYLSAYDMSLINANSGNWNAAYTNLVTNSASYLSSYDTTIFAKVSSQAYELVTTTPGISAIKPTIGNNTIQYGAYSAILGGDNNTLSADNAFVLGSNINATIPDYTYVNNLSSVGDVKTTTLRANTIQADTSIGIGQSNPLYFNLDVNGSGTGTIGNSYGDLGLGSSGSISILPNNYLVLSPVDNIIVRPSSDNTTIPNERLTVVGGISATNIIYASGGNSDQWNSVYSTVNTNSANYILDGGNTKGANIMIGTNDNFDLEFETNALRKLIITRTGIISAGTNPATIFNSGSATGNLSFAIGSGRAFGQRSFAQGNNTIAFGSNSYVEGSATRASGSSSHAEGTSTQATNTNSHAEGSGAVASGQQSHAEGTNTTASGTASHAEGQSTQSTGNRSHAEGTSTIAQGTNSHAEGDTTTASGSRSHTEGINTQATNDNTHAEGQNSQATGINAHAEGFSTVASGNQSHAEGVRSISSGGVSHAEGRDTVASGSISTAHGNQSIASGDISFVAGSNNFAAGSGSVVFGAYAAAGKGLDFAWVSDFSLTNQVSTTRSEQFMVSAAGGIYLAERVGINTDNIDNALTVNGTISTGKIQSGAFIATPSSINNQTVTTYVLSDNDNGRIITLSASSAISLNVPSGLPVGFNVIAIQIGTGQVSVSAGNGVIINSDGAKTKIASQHSSASIVSYDTNIFNLAGNLTT